ncbi:MAG: DUF4363 family protein [Oscillibacter sp.]|jgi:hypothetical protein|nr:DUF4363 family protein [Oscillibacter sp.]
MKRALFLPAAVLGLLLAFSLWNSFAMSAHVQRWQSQVDEAIRLAEDGDWSGAAAALDAGYADWSRRQTYLHTVTQHDAVDDAGAMYHRAMAFAACQEDSEFQAEAAGLRDQLRLLAEMEQFSVKNIL